MSSNSPPKKKINLSRSKMKMKEFEFVLNLSKNLSTKQLDNIIHIFNLNGFRHLLVNDKKLTPNYILFLRFGNTQALLKEADKHHFLKKTYNNNKSKQQTDNSLNITPKNHLAKFFEGKSAAILDPRVKELEAMERFTFVKRRKFLKESSSITSTPAKSPNKIISELEDGEKKSPTAPTVKFNMDNNGVHEADPPKSANLREDFLKSPLPSSLKKRPRINSLTAMTPDKNLLLSLNSETKSIIKEENQGENFEEYLKIFTPSELLKIVWSILSSIEVDVSDPFFLETFHLKPSQDYYKGKKKFIDFLTKKKILISINPLHTKDLYQLFVDPNSYTDYFGQKVSMYFHFMRFYIKWLGIPAISGIIVQLVVPHSNIYLKFWIEMAYCLIIMIWAPLFVRFWERKTNELRVTWGTYGSQFRISNTRHQFKGDTRINPITELPELYYPKKKKIAMYFLSFLIHLPFFMLSLFVTVLFLNIKGNVSPSHWIYFESLTQLSRPGALFDKTSSMRIVVSIIQVSLKVILTNYHNNLTKKTTEQENHRTHTSFNNSFTIKKFIFGITYNFLILAYIAFWRFDVNGLRAELVSFYASDQVKRLVNESLTPYILGKLIAKRSSKSKFYQDPKSPMIRQNSKQTLEEAKQSLQEYVVEKTNEIYQMEYNSYEDYYEMIIQFGYITLFAIIFPLSGALSLLFNLIELMSDSFKLRSTLRRPLPEAVNGIGSWLTALKTMCYLCIITNSIFIAYSAEFRVTVTDQIIEQSGDIEGKMLAIIFLLEHVMLAVTYALRSLVKSEPSWVRVYIKRNHEKGTGLWF